MLEKIEPRQKMSEQQYKPALGKSQVRLRELEWEIFRKQIPVLCVFEGWDAAGKGGAIKRVTEVLDPRGYTVATYAAPHGDDRSHHYLWRFWRNLPRAGHLAIWDRSHYGRVLVERIEGFCAEEEWRRAYHEINEFEAHQVAFGMVICKFWLHISKTEQLRRFKSRELDPYRAYKLTDEDWRNRAKWDVYWQGVEDMLVHTSTPHAPWTVVEADNKLYARAKVVRTIVNAIERRMEK
jgi:AMP-polyphosphate phosphotransferase